MIKALLYCMAALPLVAGAQTSDGITRVYDYCPAPGQFVNMLPKGETRAEMIANAQTAISQTSGMICLGAFGGYVTFGWERPIVNGEGPDFKVVGNAFANNNEAGVVMVSVDRNGNGVPDDEWYELAGSEYRAEGTFHDFSVTYQRPDDELNADGYAWTSNDPSMPEGVVKRNTFHKQAYWPAWLTDNTMTFTGTRLRSYGVLNGKMWTLPQFTDGYGYVDHSAAADDQGLDIDWAVNRDGTPVKLGHIDFVKVYTGSLQDCGQIGEVSTEISYGQYLHPEAECGQEPMAVATFDNAPLNPGQQWWCHRAYDEDESLVDATFTSGDWEFNNSYMPDYDSWMFYGVSATKTNDFEGYQTGMYNSACGGAHSGSQFGVIFGDALMGINKASLIGRGDKVVPGVYVTNDAWNVDAYLNGDGMTDGGFKEGDWFKVTITGLTQAQVDDDSVIDSKKDSDKKVEIYLADYRSSDPSQRGYIKDWTWVDLSSLGAVHELRMAFDSSRRNSWGITTPSYMCLDDLGASEPSSGIDGITAPDASAEVIARYDLQGRRVDAHYRGIVIERLSNGQARKAVQ